MKLLTAIKEQFPNSSWAESNLYDFDFSKADFLEKPEVISDEKGVLLKQLYTYKGDEVLHIEYKKIYEDVTIDGITYVDQFVAFQDVINYINSDGVTYQSKFRQKHPFNLATYEDLSGNIEGLASYSQRNYLRNERKVWAGKMEAINPLMFAMLESGYTSEFNLYINSGSKTALVDRMNADAISASADVDIVARKAVFTKMFEGTSFTVLQVILSTLQ